MPFGRSHHPATKTQVIVYSCEGSTGHYGKKRETAIRRALWDIQLHQGGHELSREQPCDIHVVIREVPANFKER